MTIQPGSGPRPRLDVRGAVDLSALNPRRPDGGAPSAASGGSATGVVVAITDVNFNTEVMQRSQTIPVVMDFWATWCEPCKQLSPVLEKLAAEFEGRFILATVDVDANPQLAQAFQVQSIPSVYAVLGGRPLPLFQGAQPEAQIRAVLDELLRVAKTNGIDGRVALSDSTEEAEAPEEEELPPHHQAAYDAIEAGDLAGAVAAYEAALAENPGDDLARLGMAQALLLQRTAEVDAPAARAAAAANPTDVDAQCLVADLDLLGGHVADSFTRLIDTVRITSGAERDQARNHLIGLFDLVGPEDPRVAAARTKLANALF